MLKLMPHQEEGVKFLQKRKAILAFKMRVGKTPTALMRLVSGQPCLVLCPKSAIGVWRKHARDWRPEYTASTPKEFRWPQWNEIVILNYERACCSTWPEAHTVLYLDEFSMCKTPTATRTKRAKYISDAILAQNGCVYGLTGTPIERDPMDLWNLMCFLHIETMFFKDKHSFIEKMGGTKLGYGYLWSTPSPYVWWYLEQFMMTKSLEEILPNLPPVEEEELPIFLEDGDRIKDLCDKFLQELDAVGIGLDQVLEAPKYLPGDLIFRLRKEVAHVKIPHMLEHLDFLEAEGLRVLVFSAHRDPIDILAKRPGWGIITGAVNSDQKRTEVAEQFQSGKLKGIGLTVGAGRFSIDLTGADVVLFVDKPWNSTDVDQSIARALGPRQTKPVLIQSMVLDHPVDEKVNALLRYKASFIHQILQPGVAQKYDERNTRGWTTPTVFK